MSIREGVRNEAFLGESAANRVILLERYAETLGSENARLTKENARLTNVVGRLKNLFPGREALSILRRIIGDWEDFCMTAETPDGGAWMDDDDDLLMLHHVNEYAVGLIDRLFQCRSALRGPSKADRQVAQLRKDLDEGMTEGIDV